MSRIQTVCLPASAAGFAQRVPEVIAQDRWDIVSPEGIAVVRSVLR